MDLITFVRQMCAVDNLCIYIMSQDVNSKTLIVPRDGALHVDNMCSLENPHKGLTCSSLQSLILFKRLADLFSKSEFIEKRVSKPLM